MRGKSRSPRNAPTADSRKPSAGFLVRKEGLEPSRFYPPDPKSGASANSATFAGKVLPKGTAVRMESPELRMMNPAPETEMIPRLLCLEGFGTLEVRPALECTGGGIE